MGRNIADVPADNRSGYARGPIKLGGAVPRLMRKYPNLWVDISARSSYNTLTRDPVFGLEFFDEFQDKLMFGTNSYLRSDVNIKYPNV
ncbi:MAG: hypothetical protein GX754_01500 [Clostridiaceae bacterium]|nr:hypothetical protein [Clostridiaceae bacterium]